MTNRCIIMLLCVFDVVCFCLFLKCTRLGLTLETAPYCLIIIVVVIIIIIIIIVF